MALSGSVTTSKYSGYGLQLSWTATQSVANNTSTIKWTLKSVGGTTTYYNVSGPVTVTINGTTVYSTTSRFNLYGAGAWSRSGSLTINHNSDGTKSFSVNIQAAIYSTSVNCTGSATFTLNKIARTPTAPTSMTATGGTGGFIVLTEPVTLKWSGATGNITGYEYQYYYNGSWRGSTTTTNTSVTFTATDATFWKSGTTTQWRVRALNGSLASDWKTSNVLTVAGAMRIRVAGAWKAGSVWIKVNGTWKRAKRVWIKVDGTWRQAK